MILTIDIGNTNIHLGLFKKRRLIRDMRFSTRSPLTPYESFLMARELAPKKLKGGVLGSVVPPLTHSFTNMFKVYYSIQPFLVEPENVTGLKFSYKDPSAIGADRIANAIGALKEYKRDVIIVDFGTATTFDIVTKERIYLGGVIAPGIEISLEALINKAAKLPKVEIVIPEKCVGENTEECVQSGVFFSLLGQVKTIVEEIRKEVGRNFFVIATGGLSEMLSSELEVIDKADPLLTLKGLLEIYYAKGIP